MNTTKPTLHMIGLFHTIPNHDYDHCAFTGKVLRFAKMMQAEGYKVIEYSNGESISGADEQVEILTAEEVGEYTKGVDNFMTLGKLDTPMWQNFQDRLIPEMAKRIKKYDIVCHPFGPAHSILVSIFPDVHHVETGIGYETGSFGAFRIYESYAWMHYQLGKYGKWGSRYDFVVNNYLDKDEWEPSYEAGKYLLYTGRIIDSKGMAVIQEIAKRTSIPVVLAGMGDVEKFSGENMDFIGYVHGVKEKNDLFKNAIALLAPTEYIEPFGTVTIEAMMSGTPVIASDFGAFTETIEHGKTGFRCRTLGDFMKAIEYVGSLDRKYIAEEARKRFSYEVIGEKYDQVFKQISDLKNEGWYTEESRFIKPLK